jgi:hypothetical protein
MATRLQPVANRKLLIRRISKKKIEVAKVIRAAGRKRALI